MDDGANIEPTPVAPTAFAFFPVCTSFFATAIHNVHTKALCNDSERCFYYSYRWNGYLKASNPVHLLVSLVVIAFFSQSYCIFLCWLIFWGIFRDRCLIVLHVCMLYCIYMSISKTVQRTKHRAPCILSRPSPFLPCSHLLKWIFTLYWLALNPQQWLSFACGRDHQWENKKIIRTMKKRDGWSWEMQEEKERIRCVAVGKDIKIKYFSLNRAPLNNPPIILCFSAHHWALDCDAIQSYMPSSVQTAREKKQRGWQKCEGLQWMVGQAPHCRIPER